MKSRKKQEGITLIALVITIIVLLILAGVAIAMLSGENGILKKAAEAKTKTDEAQIQEEITLTDMDLDSHFIINNSKYKCKYGMITGIELGDTVKQLEDAMPDGYKVVGITKYENSNSTELEISDEEKVDLKIATGMKIEKNGKEVARTVLYGDITGDGEIDGSDVSYLSTYLVQYAFYLPNYIKEAMDVTHDAYISDKDFQEEVQGKNREVKSDSNYIGEYHVGGEKVVQNHYAIDPNKIKVIGYKLIVEEFLDNLPQNFINSKYKFVKQENSVYCNLEGVTSETTAKEILDLLPEVTIKKKSTIYTGEETLTSGTYKIYIPTNKYGYTDPISMGSFKI